MALENLVGTDKYIGNLVITNPVATDDRREGDDHLRGIKNVLKNQFPNVGAAALPLIASGTYTPTITNGVNVAASTPNASATWIRVGNVVTVSLQVSIDPTAASTTTTIGISLPVASNLASFTQLTGTITRVAAAGLANLGSGVIGDPTADGATATFINDTELGNRNFSVTFQYVVA